MAATFRILLILFSGMFLLPTEAFSVDTLYKELQFNKHTLKDEYKYGRQQRRFKWDEIMKMLNNLDHFTEGHEDFGYLVNYKNRKGAAPLVKIYERNERYNGVQDTFGVLKYQAIPLYTFADTLRPERYGRDGSLLTICGVYPNFYEVEIASIPVGKWLVPKKYVNLIPNQYFTHVVAIDRKFQNIATLEKVNDKWYIRSMNPATTGVYRPPFSKLTPEGIFVLQQKKYKMFYYKDGTTDIEGYAPYANRFCCGGYIHGVPVNDPEGEMREYAWSLGTVPRSHMCVRNATSHAKFIYDYFPTGGTIVYVFE